MYIEYCNLINIKELARKVAIQINIKDTILLKGDLGVGKTTFTQHLIAFFIDKVIVSSPTFSIVNLYKAPKFNIWHFDLYKIKHISEMHEIGIEEAFETGVSIIEWPEIIIDIIPKNALKIEISTTKNEDIRLFKIYK